MLPLRAHDADHTSRHTRYILLIAYETVLTVLTWYTSSRPHIILVPVDRNHIFYSTALQLTVLKARPKQIADSYCTCTVQCKSLIFCSAFRHCLRPRRPVSTVQHSTFVPCNNDTGRYNFFSVVCLHNNSGTFIISRRSPAKFKIHAFFSTLRPNSIGAIREHFQLQARKHRQLAQWVTLLALSLMTNVARMLLILLHRPYR